MSASMSVDVSGLKRLILALKDPAIEEELTRLSQDKGIAALVGQAIADNFNQEGPGWQPLSPITIKRSVAKGMQKKLSRLYDSEIVELERLLRTPNKSKMQMLSFHKLNAKMKNKSPMTAPTRKILQVTRLLKKSVTTPGAQHNIYRTDRFNLIWGTDLFYAGVHNYGWKQIPQREYLVIRKVWEDQIYDYVLDRSIQIIQTKFGGVT